MGNTNFKTENIEGHNIHAVSKNNFLYNFCIGKGGFGKVWRVERKKSRAQYAMKEMSKARIITKRSVKSVINERQILAQLQNVFIVNMYYAFQDRENLYLVMDYLSGGDLRYHICRHRRFTEEVTRFFVACLVSGLEYFHEKNIIHRDIKPENLVLEGDGYLRITDFGIARVWREENAQDTSGTPGYMAPEVMCRQNHTTSVDYFAVGVMAYECMFGKRPYIGKSRKEIRDHILSKQIQIKRQDIPRGWSVEAADFINKMIQRKPQNRLGNGGVHEVKDHPWLRDFPWTDLAEKKLQSPFIPPKEDNFDQKNINEEWKDLEDENFKENAVSLKRQSTQDLFAGYYYDYQVAAIAQNQKVIELGFSNMIMQQIQTIEIKSQQMDPVQMATSSSSATFQGVYEHVQEVEKQERQQQSKSLVNQVQLSAHRKANASHQSPYHRHNFSQHESSLNQLGNVQINSPLPSSGYSRDQMPLSQQNNFMNDPVQTYAQNTSSLQRPLSNTASSTLNAGITSQHTHSHSYSQSMSHSKTYNHNSNKNSRHASKHQSATHNGISTAQGSSHHSHANSVTLQPHVQSQNQTLNGHQHSTLSASYLHANASNSSSVVSSVHKRNNNSLTQSANMSKQQLGPVHGSQTQMASSNGLGLSLKHQQLRQSQHSTHYQQQLLVAQQQQAMLMQQQNQIRHQKTHSNKIKIQSTHGSKSFQGTQHFAKSECPTPKTREIEQARHTNQQKFFSRKSSGAQHAQFQNISMQPSVIHQQHVIMSQQVPGGLSRQAVQSQGHSRRQSGRQSEIVIGGTIQHPKAKAGGLLGQSENHERNGFSNRQKHTGGSYHASSLSFSKGKSNNYSGLQNGNPIHQPYQGTNSGLHSHNSSIHSSHTKNRPSQHMNANAQNIAISGGLHKNSLSLGHYDTAKIKVSKHQTRKRALHAQSLSGQQSYSYN